MTDGAGNQQSFNYNLFRNLTEFTDEHGNVETYIHQDNGLLTKQIHDDRSRLEFAWGPQTGSGGRAMGRVPDEELDRRARRLERSLRTTPLTQQRYSRPGELHTSKSKDQTLQHVHLQIPSVYQLRRHRSRKLPKRNVSSNGQYTYDANGNVLTATDAEGPRHLVRILRLLGPGPSARPAEIRNLAQGCEQSTSHAGETYEAVPWKTLTNALTITGDTISVQLRTAIAGQYVVADAIRIDRLDKNGVYTRIIDSNAAGTDPNFRLGPGGGIPFNATATPTGALTFESRELVRSKRALRGSSAISNLGRIESRRPGSRMPQTVPRRSTWIHEGLPDAAAEQTITGINQSVAPDSFRSYQTLFEYDTAGNLTRSITEGLPAGRRAYDSLGNVVYEEEATGVATVNSYDPFLAGW